MDHRWLGHVRDLILPPICCLCGDPATASINLCHGCRDDLPWNTRACRRCALPLPSGAGHGECCAQCLRRPPPFDTAVAAWRYASPVDFLITGLKYRSRLDYARLLGELLGASLRAKPRRSWPDCLIPVPLHRERLRERGFNQALELARPLARHLGLALDQARCRRTRATPHQTDLPARERRSNVGGAFAATSSLAGAHVAIVDDVITTGHTVSELARTLRRAGASRVEIWACARASAPGNR